MAKVKEEVAPVIPDAEDTAGKPPEGYSAEEWSDLSETERLGIIDGIAHPNDEEEETLTEEELAAAAGGEKTEEEKAAEAKALEDKKVADAELAKQQAADAELAKASGKTVEQIASDRAAAQETEKAKGGEVTPTDEELLGFRPVVSDSELPAVDAVPAEIQTKLDELDAKYEAGDIDLKAYNKDRDALNRQVVMSNVQAREQVKEAKVWEKEQNAFLRGRTEYLGTKQADGSFKGSLRSNALFGALSQAVTTINADPKYSGASGMEILIAADKAVKDAFGIKPEADPNPARKKEGKPPAPIPGHKTLAEVPAAAPNSVDGAWAALDKLHGEAYEAALERMTPDQRDRYLAAR